MLGTLELNIGKFKGRFENDGTQTPLGDLGDGGDGFRTASGDLSFGNFYLGYKLYTGGGRDDSKYFKDNTDPKYPNGYYNSPGVDKYRAGIFYVGYKQYQIGWNNEAIRDAIQNTIHKGLNMRCTPMVGQ